MMQYVTELRFSTRYSDELKLSWDHDITCKLIHRKCH